MPTKADAPLLICRESFVGNLTDTEIFVGVRGKTVIDPASGEGKRVLRHWAKFFGPVISREEEQASVPLQVAL